MDGPAGAPRAPQKGNQMLKLINRIAAILTLAASFALGQSPVEEVLARAEFARSESHDLNEARTLY